MRPIALVLPALAICGLGWACLAKYQAQKAANKVYTDRMSPFEVSMWSQVPCDRCGAFLDAYNPKDGVYYNRKGQALSLHETCAAALIRDNRPRKGKHHG